MVGCAALQGSPRTDAEATSLVASSPTVDFGTLVVGNSEVISDYIFNPTDSNITISKATVTGTGFQITSPTLPVTIPAGQRTRFIINCAPSGLGDLTATIAITSNAPQSAMTVLLHVTAIPAGELTVNPSSITFGSVSLGNSQSKAASFVNAGDTSLTISGVSVTASDFALSGLSLPVTLASKQSVNFAVIFAPKAGGTRQATISVSATASLLTPTANLRRRGLSEGAERAEREYATAENETLTIPVVGVGTQVSSTSAALGQLTPAPGSLSFGSAQLSSSQNKPLVVTNTGTASVTVTQASASGAGYSLSGPTLPLALAATQSASFTVTFAPQTAGAASGNVMIASNASNPTLNVGLSATVLAPGVLAVASNPVAFGTVPVGNSQKQSATLTNSGASSVTVTQAAVTGTGFSLAGMGMPMTLAPSQSANVSITCSPKSAGTLNGTLTVTSNATNAALAVPLVATAVMPGALTVSPSSFSFGSVQTGSGQTLPGTLTNTGGSSVTISGASFTGSGYSITGLSLPATLQPGTSASFNVVFDPQSAGAASSNLSVASNATNPTLAVPVSGTGITPGSLRASASTLSFGNVQVNGSQTLPETLTNSGGSSLTITQAAAGAGYTVTGLTLPLTLAAGSSTSFSVVFSPQSAGTDNLSLAITTSASASPFTVALSGAGVAAGALTVGPSSFSFGPVPTGTSQTLPATLTNTGGSSVTVSQATFTGAGYSITGLSLPVTLAASQSTSFNVVFTPQTAGAANFNLSITSNAPNPNLTAPVSGTGTTAGAISIGVPSLSFGNVPVGSTQTLAETLTNSGGSSITLTQAAAGAGYSVSGLSLPLVLAAGKSASFNVVFSPQSAGSSSVNLVVTTNGSPAAVTIPLSGAGSASGTLTAKAVSFGSVQVGQSSTLPATLTNSGGSSLTVTQANLTGTGFTMTGMSMPLTLSVGQSFTFNVTFAPQASGPASGSIALASNASNAAPSISLSGTGTAAGQFSVSPGSFGFGSVVVGASKSLPVTISATGASVSVTSASVSSSEFSLSGPSLPMTLQAGANASFTLTFTPQASGAATANVAFTSNASSNPVTEAATGTGTPAPQHSVTLSWSPSASSSVAGYNVYRGGKTGGPYTRVNPSADASMSYTDSTVQAGQTYFYVTTAVGSDGVESSYSNQVSAAIPTP